MWHHGHRVTTRVTTLDDALDDLGGDAHDEDLDSDEDLDLDDEFGDDDVEGDVGEAFDDVVDGEPLVSGTDREPVDTEPANESDVVRARRQWSPDDLTRRRCESKSGVSLDPTDVFTAAVLGRVRRIVIDSNGIIVDAGHRRRCFTGAMRDVLMVATARCDWIGCDARNREADHLKPWGENGKTALDNAGVPCRWHNNRKNLGFIARRDDDGNWHYHRPDGTEITPI